MYNVVYIDPDILIIQDLHSLFERDFDYLMTISENEEQPINGAMHFVPKGKYHQVFPLRSAPKRGSHWSKRLTSYESLKRIQNKGFETMHNQCVDRY